MTDLRQGVSETAHAVLDAVDRLRDPAIAPDRLERQLASYGALQAGYARNLGNVIGAGGRRHAAIEGAAALILLAELLELRGEG